MAYLEFHKVPPELEGCVVKPVFHDSDGSPVYEGPYQSLLSHIVAKNDVVSLYRYHASPHERVFWKEYENPSWHPFFVARTEGHCEVLRALLEIFLADYQSTSPDFPPLSEYLAQLRFSPLHIACENANQDFTLWLLQAHNPPLATLYDQDMRRGGDTPLIAAVRRLRRNQGAQDEQEKFVYFLLEKLACSVPESDAYLPISPTKEQDEDKEVQTREFNATVLGAAAPNASYQMIISLIAAGANVHARQRWSDSYRWTPGEQIIRDSGRVTALHIASLYGNLEAIRALVDHRGEGVSVGEFVGGPSATDDEGRLPLHWALLGASDRNDPDDIETTSRSSRMMETVKWLLNANPATIQACDCQGETVFHYAVRSRATDTVGIRALVIMLLDAARPRALYLLNPTVKTSSVLEYAVEHHSRRYCPYNMSDLVGLVEILLAQGADARYCLHRLCEASWLEPINPGTVDCLLDSSDINDKDANGSTALHYLARHLDQLEAGRHLIQRGADVNAVNYAGNTPLHDVMKGAMLQRPTLGPDALARAREDWIQVLVEAGGLIDQQNATGQTPAQLLRERTERQRPH